MEVKNKNGSPKSSKSQEKKDSAQEAELANGQSEFFSFIPTTSFEQQGSAISYNTQLFLGGEWINIPGILITNETIFRSVLNKESFNSLSQPAKNHLRRYLPESEGTTFDDLLNCTFIEDNNFCFGNPLNQFFTKIRDGYFSAADHVQLRDHKRVLYDHYIRHYQMNLLKRLLINRHAVLEQASKLQASEPTKIMPKMFTSQRKLAKYENIRRRAMTRTRRMIDDCRTKAGQTAGPSSDESTTEDDCTAPVSTPLPLPPNARSTMFVDKFSADLDLYQPIRMKTVNELYQEYCYLRETEPDCPSLDITDITLEEVYERTGISFQTERNFSKITEQTLAQFTGGGGGGNRRGSTKQQPKEKQAQQNANSLIQNGHESTTGGGGEGEDGGGAQEVPQS